ncbi:hypothetical protein C7271_00030 [filamentous cyanobacterium CCP5]|nr:hypothetical protein C7271_00030 [filamentous cyanobacterium CCP5]
MNGAGLVNQILISCSSKYKLYLVAIPLKISGLTQLISMQNWDDAAMQKQQKLTRKLTVN